MFFHFGGLIGASSESYLTIDQTLDLLSLTLVSLPKSQSLKIIAAYKAQDLKHKYLQESYTKLKKKLNTKSVSLATFYREVSKERTCSQLDYDFAITYSHIKNIL